MNFVTVTKVHYDKHFFKYVKAPKETLINLEYVVSIDVVTARHLTSFEETIFEIQTTIDNKAESLIVVSRKIELLTGN